MKTIHDERYIRLVAELRRIREERGLTQVAVALKMRWSRSAVSKIETRERRVDVLEVYDLCALYGIRLADLEPLLRGERRS